MSNFVPYSEKNMLTKVQMNINQTSCIIWAIVL